MQKTLRQARHSRRSGFTLIEIMIVVAITGVLISIAAPTWMRQREVSQVRTCQENLTKISGAKQQWALETNQPPTAAPAWSDLYLSNGSSYLKTMPRCPASGTYTIGTVDIEPTCSITSPDHNADPNAVPVL